MNPKSLSPDWIFPQTLEFHNRLTHPHHFGQMIIPTQGFHASSLYSGSCEIRLHMVLSHDMLYTHNLIKSPFTSKKSEATKKPLGKSGKKYAIDFPSKYFNYSLRNSHMYRMHYNHIHNPLTTLSYYPLVPLDPFFPWFYLHVPSSFE